MPTGQNPSMPESSDTDPDDTDSDYYRINGCTCDSPFVCRGRCRTEES
jgi:hypothetical protein